MLPVGPRTIRGMCRLALSAAALLGLAAPAGAQLRVTYLANEGFLLEGGGHKVLVDALFGEGIAPYPTVPTTLRPALEGARPPYDGVDVVLATHHHGDHFNAAAVRGYLQANPEALFISTPQAVERLRREAGQERDLPGRLEAVLPAEGERQSIHHRGLEIVVVNLHHGRERRPPVQNLGFLARMGGVTWIHVGDTEVVEDDVRALQLAREHVDVALLPTWLLDGDRWLPVVRNQIRPAQVVVVHRPGPGAPATYFDPAVGPEDQVRRIRERFPGAVLPSRPGDTTTFFPDGQPRR